MDGGFKAEEFGPPARAVYFPVGLFEVASILAFSRRHIPLLPRMPRDVLEARECERKNISGERKLRPWEQGLNFYSQ